MTEIKKKENAPKTSNDTKTGNKVFPAREIILEILMQVIEDGEYSHLMIRNVLEKYNYLRAEEKAFIKRVSEGTLERMIQIDYVINQFSTVKTVKLKPVIRNILRMAIFQILFMNGIPDSAACNEAVKLTEKKKYHQLKGFVNGVLRNIARQKDQLKYPDPVKERLQYLSVSYSMPQWMIELWDKQYPEIIVEKILKGLLEEHNMVIRLREGLTPEEKATLLSDIRLAGITLKQHEYLPYAYVLEHTEGAYTIPGFAKGQLTIQDVSSMLAVEVANIQKDMNIIDVCAAPGGKAIHAADKLMGSGSVQARDLTESKTEMIQQNIDRLGIRNIEAIMADACVYDQDKKETADVVIADLPCSGLGVIGKKRDIKYHIDKDSLKSLSELQKEILGVVQNYVKKGGALIYSTCTINRGENEEVVEWFLSHYPFRMETITPFLPEQLHSPETQKGYLQLLPGIHATDGFFMARLVKEV